MKTQFILFFFLVAPFAFSQTTKSTNDDDYDAPYHMFQVGGGGSYNAMINKYGINTRFGFNFKNTITLGPEFTYYFANTKNPKPEYFYELNLSGTLVQIARVSFFALTGITYRNAIFNTDTKYSNKFQGINLGFGMQYRKDHLNLFIIEKLTSSNSNLWLTAGATYYFDIEAIRRLNNKYNLNKRTRKD